ncbi:MAG TPA: NYN domain-containing protein [Clostridia bacterium]|nr:NYN domain-containing protein [Clostridia bacterium]
MEEYLILDGYNVINSWPKLKSLMEESLETARDGLIDVMVEYGAFRDINVIIVFDGHLVKGNIGNKQKLKGVEIVFTKEYETADSYIERYIVELSKNNRVAVVTDDRIEQQMILGSGATRISVKEMAEMFDQIKNEINEKIETDRIQRNTLSDALGVSILKRLEKLRRGY